LNSMGKLFFQRGNNTEIISISLNTTDQTMGLFSVFTLKLWKFSISN